MTRANIKTVPALALAALLGGLGGCKDPPPDAGERVPAPVIADADERAELKQQAHRGALADALPRVLAAQKAGDPLAAYQLGFAEAEIPPLSPGARLAIAEQLRAAQEAVSEIDESYLPPAQVVILRAARFEITALNDELQRRPRLRQDPVAALRSVEAVLDELHYRLVRDDCDAACEALAGELAQALPEAQNQLAAASVAAAELAHERAGGLAHRSRELAARSLVAKREALKLGLEQLGAALDAHQSWLAQLVKALPAAEATHQWTAKPAPIRPGGVAVIERLPDVVGPHALIRRLSVEERVDLDPDRALAQLRAHVARWDALRRELLGGEAGEQPPGSTPAPVSVARCEAALARLTKGLATLEEQAGVAAPELDCERYVALLGDRRLGEGRLVVELLDLGVIEPQRRALRRAELPEIALVSGQWSPAVHRHLRRVMLLAQLDEPAALAAALDAGQRALCLAAAGLQIHAELGSSGELPLAGSCAALGQPQAVRAEVLGDPRGALTGFGLSLIGDEPARMVGFDRFYWAPLGLMQILATPRGMHPDEFKLPDDPRPSPVPQPEVEIEEL